MLSYPIICFGILALMQVPPAVRSRELEVLGRARALVGENRWSQAVRLLEVRDSRGRAGSQAGLLFEYAETLWYFRSQDGTRRLADLSGRTPAGREDLLALLQCVEPSATGFLAVGVPVSPDSRGEVRNGCLLRCIAEADRLAAGAGATGLGLLSYIVTTGQGRRGHTVLCYRTPSGTWVYDPDTGTEALRGGEVSGARELALRVLPERLGPRLAKAVLLPVPAGEIAFAPGGRGSGGGSLPKGAVAAPSR